MAATSLDLSQIRTDALVSASTFRTLIGVYSEAEVNSLLVTDHGALTGLGDDDHTQYALADGSRGAFAASSHTHAASDIVSGVFAIGRLATGTPDGTKFVRDDGTLAVPSGGGGGSGDVVGPASSTDNAIARFDSTTGKLLQNSSAIVDDSGNMQAATIAARGTLSTASSGTAQVAIGRQTGTLPTIMFDAGSNRWYLDTFMNAFRFVYNASAVPLTFDTSGNLTIAGNLISNGSSDTLLNIAGGNFGIGTASPSGLQVNTTVSSVARGTANARMGKGSAAYSILVLEGSSSQQWAFDNFSNALRVVRNNSSVAFQVNDNDSAFFVAPARHGLYTFATVPTASSFTHYQITISDRSSRSAYSDGTNWRFVSDDAIIS